MSLLMEALRKAEEAKSKAAKEDREKTQPRETSTDTPVQAPVRDRNAPEEFLQEEGPVIINPDPDEEETLAAHAGDADMTSPDQEVADLGDLTLDELAFGNHDEELEKIEFTTDVRKDDEEEARDAGPASSPVTTGNVGDEDDDSLSLLRSGYFRRAKPASERKVVDDFDITSDDETDTAPVSKATESTSEPLSLLEKSEPATTTDTPPQAETPYQAENPQQPEDSYRAEAAPEPAAQTDARKSREREKRQSASALFLAKQESQRRRLRKLVTIAAVILVFPLAGGIYWFYTEMTSTPQMQFNIASGGNQVQNRFLGDGLETPAPETGIVDRQVADTDASTAATPGDSSVQTLVESTLAETDSESAAPVTTETVAVVTPPAQSNANQQAAQTDADNSVPASAAASSVPQQQPQQVRTITATPASTSPVQQSNGGLNFVRTDVAPVVNPDLDAAFASYQQGELTGASQLYQQVLAKEPTNRDAMLGLASVYLKQDNVAMAQNLYARLLELNPRDPLARAGILDTIQGDPVRREGELKSLINAYPGTAPLSFALGNLYASQSRWNEAQNAYFDALLSAKSANAGPVSPDYAFNLAVSLERINQLRLALDYYREAADFARNAAPGFDPAQLEQRLNYLEQRLP